MSSSNNIKSSRSMLVLILLLLALFGAWAWSNRFQAPVEIKSAESPDARDSDKSRDVAISDENSPDSSTPNIAKYKEDGVVELEAEAEAGSAIAQRKLAIVYDSCFGYSLDPITHFATIDTLAAQSGSPKKAFERLKVRIDRRCYGANKGNPISIDLIRHLMESAAQGGDLTAKINLEMYSLDPVKAERMNEFISQAISNHDPNAMLAMSPLVRKDVDGTLEMPYSMLVGDAISEAAWAIAGCQAGANCGQGSLVLDSICMGTGVCDYASYETFLRQHMIPPGEAPRLDEYVRLILYGP